MLLHLKIHQQALSRAESLIIKILSSSLKFVDPFFQAQVHSPFSDGLTAHSVAGLARTWILLEKKRKMHISDIISMVAPEAASCLAMYNLQILHCIIYIVYSIFSEYSI